MTPRNGGAVSKYFPEAFFIMLRVFWIEFVLVFYCIVDGLVVLVFIDQMISNPYTDHTAYHLT